MLRRYGTRSALLAVLALLAIQLALFAQKDADTPNAASAASIGTPLSPSDGVQANSGGAAPLRRLGLKRAAPSRPAAATAVLERIRRERVRVAAAKVTPQEAITSPAAYDNSAGLPPIGDQGQQGSCVSWATGYYYKSYQEWKEYGWSLTDSAHQFSPAFLYNQVQNDDGGSYFEDNFALLDDQGCCSMATMPYNAADHLTWPSAAAYREGIPHRGQSYEYLGSGQTTDIFPAVKAVISSGDLCIVGIPVYRPTPTTAGRFDRLSPTDDQYDGPAPADKVLAGNHALTIVAYDESRFSGAGGYKIVNSWGTGWGNHGFAWLSQRFLTTYAFGFYRMTDRIGYAPTALVHYRVSHASWSSDQVAVTLGVGDTAGAFWSKVMDAAIPRNALIMDRWADLTEGGYMPPASANPWWIRVEDHVAGNAATLSVFDIEYDGSVYSPSSALPQDGPLAPGNLFVYVPTAPTAPANDNFSSPTAISATGADVTGTNMFATKEAGEPNHAGNSGGKSVWWTWTPTTTGSAQVDTIGSSFDTILGVYTGSSVSALTTVAGDDDSGGGLTSKVALSAVAGTTYQIAVDGYGGASGSITMHVIAPPVSAIVQSSPSGRSFTVDGVTYASAQVFSWAPGSNHTIAVSSPQSGDAGTQYVWNSWSDSGEASHTVAPTVGATYTANFTTQYSLTMSMGTGGGSISPAGGWQDSAAIVPISATPADGYSFDSWSGSGSGSYSGSSSSASVTMNGPITQTASFRTIATGVTVTSPNGGESWAKGTSHAITWTSTLGGNVKIEVYKSGVYKSTISSNTANDGSYTWSVSSTLPAGTDYKVKITSTADVAKYDFSDASFTIPPYFSVSEPASGRVWKRGTTQAVKWTSNAGGTVKLELYKGTVLDSVIAPTMSNAIIGTNSYSWPIPPTQAMSPSYKIKVTSIESTAVYANSGTFSITGNGTFVTVSSPNGGEIWQVGNTYNVTWTSDCEDGIKIELYKAGKLNKSLTSLTANTGSYSWPISTSQTLGSDYTVKVTCASNSALNDVSNANFSITMRAVTISALSMTPTTVRPGQNVTANSISGTYQAGTPTETTRIVLGLRDTSGHWAGGEPVVVFAATPGDTLSHAWTGSTPTISAPTKTGSYYFWALNSSAADDAAAIADFKARTVTSSVTPNNKWPATLTVSGQVIAVTYPNGGETWTTGSSYTITWTSYVGGNVNVDLYKGGTKVLTVGAAIPNSGSCPWTVPVGYTPSTSYRVKVTSTTSSSWYDYGDAYFTIAAGGAAPQVTEAPLTSTPATSGEPASTEPLAKVTAKVAAASNSGSSSSALVDGDAATSWQTVGTTLAETESVTLDAGAVTLLGAIGLAPGSDIMLFPSEFKIEASADGRAWVPVIYARDFRATGPSLWRFEATDARYVRVSGPGVANASDGRYYWQLGEVVVYRSTAK